MNACGAYANHAPLFTITRARTFTIVFCAFARLRERNKIGSRRSMPLKLAGLSSDMDDFWLRSIVRDGLLSRAEGTALSSLRLFLSRLARINSRGRLWLFEENVVFLFLNSNVNCN